MHVTAICTHEGCGFKQLPNGNRTCHSCQVTYTPTPASLRAFSFDPSLLLEGGVLPELRAAFARFRQAPFWVCAQRMAARAGTLFSRWLVEPYQDWRKRRIIARSFVDVNAKCPGCGHTDGVIRFSPAHEVIIHRCNVCHSVWGEKTIVKHDDWKVNITADEVSGGRIA